MTPREKLAVHEAGHAIAGQLLRHRVKSVRVEACEAWDGIARFERVPELALEWIAENPHALVTAAGMAGEGLIFGSHAYGFRGRMPEGADPTGYVKAEDYFSLKELDATDGLGQLCLMAAAMGFRDPEAIQDRVEAWITEAAEVLANHRGQLMDLCELCSSAKRYRVTRCERSYTRK